MSSLHNRRSDYLDTLIVSDGPCSAVIPNSSDRVAHTVILMATSEEPVVFSTRRVCVSSDDPSLYCLFSMDVILCFPVLYQVANIWRPLLPPDVIHHEECRGYQYSFVLTNPRDFQQQQR
ncbi:hypothetical protein OTU49_001886 [Cherax quadricarinatus]|uniref:Uncharacterized protein n=1 Tax=Cherax quadricarinatus TaxID=27406 RepID=A0AAW0XRL6_CHEQU